MGPDDRRPAAATPCRPTTSSTSRRGSSSSRRPARSTSTPKLSVIRQRAVGDGFHEELTILNHSDEPVDLTIRIDAGCDFADLFEVKDALQEARHVRHAGRGRPARPRATPRDVPARDDDLRPRRRPRIDEHGLTFTVRLEPHGSWTTDLDVVTSLSGGRAATSRQPKYGRVEPSRPSRTWQRSLDEWIDGGAPPRMRLGAAEGDLPAQPRRPRRPPVLAAGRRRPEPARGRPAVVHDDVRARQHLHQPPGAAVRAGARGDDAARPRRVAGHAPRRLPRRGPRADPARDALRRDGGVRGAPALAVLRRGRRHAAVRRSSSTSTSAGPATRARPRPRARGARRHQLDRPVRRPDGQRLHLVQAAQRADRPREPVAGRTPGTRSRTRDGRLPELPAGHVRAPGLRLRREAARRAPGPRSSGRTRPGPIGSRPRRRISSDASTATSGSPIAATSRSPSTPTAARSTRSRRTSACCCGAASSTRTRRSRSSTT